VPRDDRERTFADRLLPSPTEPAFELPDHYVWGADVVQGPDGRYHLFAARWPHDAGPFNDAWGTDSEIVRATADTPVGPFSLAETVVEPWAHNPDILRIGDRYVLYYLGPGWEVHLLVAEHPAGPWTHHETGIGAPANPTAAVRDDGTIVLVIKQTDDDLGRRYDCYLAEEIAGPYTLANKQVFSLAPTGPTEDMTIWNAGGFFHLVSNWGPKADFSATEGFHALSRDGVEWQVPERADAFPLRVEYDDGSVTDFGDGGSLERVKVYAPGGTATHMYRAVAPEGKTGATPASNTWSMVTPLRRPLSVEIETAGADPARIDPDAEDALRVSVSHPEISPDRIDAGSLRLGSVDAVNDGRGARPTAVAATNAGLTLRVPTTGLGFEATSIDYLLKVVGESVGDELLSGYERVEIG
jgi:hypothetical protein